MKRYLSRRSESNKSEKVSIIELIVSIIFLAVALFFVGAAISLIIKLFSK